METMDSYSPMCLTFIFDKYPNIDNSFEKIVIFGMELDTHLNK